MIKINRSFSIEVEKLVWRGPLPSGPNGLTSLECSLCHGELGDRKWASAWVKDAKGNRGMRLCFDCASAATEDPIELTTIKGYKVVYIVEWRFDTLTLTDSTIFHAASTLEKAIEFMKTYVDDESNRPWYWAVTMEPIDLNIWKYLEDKNKDPSILDAFKTTLYHKDGTPWEDIPE